MMNSFPETVKMNFGRIVNNMENPKMSMKTDSQSGIKLGYLNLDFFSELLLGLILSFLSI